MNGPGDTASRTDTSAGAQLPSLLPRYRFPDNPDTNFWIEGVAVGELRIQRCTRCGAVRHPPRPMCPECNSLAWDYTLSAGLGVVYSFVVVREPTLFLPAVPYVCALVEIEDGIRLVGNMVDIPPDRVEIGLEVEVVYLADEGDDLVLPAWRRREAR